MAAGTFAYYCSGHGYGHATRVSAFTCHLLNLPFERRPTVYIVSSAPEHVFSDSIALGAHYRFAEIDPVIVQPLAYRVDRVKSVHALRAFLARKDVLLQAEVSWLSSIDVRCVLSDAAFLGCIAAKHAGVPSALITNFTFDSVYSYLSTTFTDQPETLQSSFDSFIPDTPVAESEIMPLVEHIHAGYRCADLLLLLPGNIPIPSFSKEPKLPAHLWVDTTLNRFKPGIADHIRSVDMSDLYPTIPFPSTSRLSNKLIPRKIRHAPLLVRPCVDAYTQAGRSRLLSSLNVPTDLHHSDTKILVVSFGGQVFKSPSRTNSRPRSRRDSQIFKNDRSIPGLGIITDQLVQLAFSSYDDINLHEQLKILGVAELPVLERMSDPVEKEKYEDLQPIASPRIATSSHIWIPGAPPAIKPLVSPKSPTSVATPPSFFPSFSMIPPTPKIEQENSFDVDAQLLPDDSWIAIVCGVTKDQWQSQDDSELPEGFYLAPRDVYMPDLTAVADVLLGKLGYGTVSECVDAHTPFVYVSRPLFIEEHGLRLLLEKDGIGVELSRDAYESGEWADAVKEAWSKGKVLKEAHRQMGGTNYRQEQGARMAESLVDWVDECWNNT